MNSKGHLAFSIIKSVVRIIACTTAVMTQSLTVLAVGLGLAEVLGIVEELVDMR